MLRHASAGAASCLLVFDKRWWVLKLRFAGAEDGQRLLLTSTGGCYEEAC